jgi:mevalonate kinase
LFRKKNNVKHPLNFHDPYRGLGGLGASSAQFLGAYWADCYVHGKLITEQDMMKQYLDVAWLGEGKRPSGYDVLAQASQGCVFINSKQSVYESHAWPFNSMAFILVHTGKKLATHEHLKQLTFNEAKSTVLYDISLSAFQAFKDAHAAQLVEAVNRYYAELLAMNLVATHTIQQIEYYRSLINPLAIKGCGALGADVILMLVSSDRVLTVTEQIFQAGYCVLSSSEQLYPNNQQQVSKKLFF